MPSSCGRGCIEALGALEVFSEGAATGDEAAADRVLYTAGDRDVTTRGSLKAGSSGAEATRRTTAASRAEVLLELPRGRASSL
mmetsp:Transcript_138665/g.244994  ORF Transcript_138665/g.244994 Transcript_138665/m.244994 type:complete len:83 (-) Transcript_138665:4-252(-)